MDTSNDQNKDPRSQPSQSETRRPEPAHGASPRGSTGDSSGKSPASVETLAARVAQLSDELRQQRTAFQDAEVALVSRIADVDDDRRQAATRLHRTLQAQREDLDERLRRQGSLVAILLFFTLLLVGGALVFTYYRLDAMRQSLTTQVDDVKQALKQIEIPAAVQQDPTIRGKLDALSATVAEISGTLERLSQEVDSVEASVKAPPPEKPAPSETASVTPSPAVSPNARTAREAESTPPPEAAEERPESAVAATERQEGASSDVESAATSPAEESPLESAPAVGSAPSPSPAEPEQRTQPPVEEPTSTAAPTPEAGAEPEQAPAETATAPGAPATSAAEGDRVDLSAMPFTVQLMGFYSLDSMAKFVREHDLPKTLYYQTTTYQGRPWYVLIHSLHPTQEAAEAVVSKLPKDLSKLSIWIRRLDADKDVRRYDQPAQ